MPGRSVLRIGLPWWLLSLPMLGFLTLPLAVLLVQSSPNEIVQSLASPSVFQAVGISLKTSLVSLAITILLGTPLALVLARKAFPLRKAIDTFIDLPMVLPPAVAGVALLITFGRNGLLGPYFSFFNIQIPFTQIAVIIAQVFVSAPLFIRSAIAGIARVEHELEEAALLDGATTFQVLRHVTLPIASPAFLGGAVLMWARALGEFGATIIFAGNLPGRTQTMPLAIYLGFEMDMQVALTLSVILVGTSFLIMALLRHILSL